MDARLADRPSLRRWTRKEYDRLIELGFFDEDEKIELLDGQLVVHEPQGARHAAVIRRVTRALRAALGDGWQVDSQLPLALDDDSEPEPDISVVASDPLDYRTDHPSRPSLVVEVADRSYRIDHRFKASLYARGGVPEYWIVDIIHEALEVHRDPERVTEAVASDAEAPDAPLGWRYGSVVTLRPPATVTPLIVPAAAIPVAELVP